MPLADVVLSKPNLNIMKGIVAADNPAEMYTPATVGPVTFNAPRTLGTRFSGTITSTGLAAKPISSYLANINQAHRSGTSLRGVQACEVIDDDEAGEVIARKQLSPAGPERFTRSGP